MSIESAAIRGAVGAAEIARHGNGWRSSRIADLRALIVYYVDNGDAITSMEYADELRRLESFE